ncbi:hypothetical protein EG329_009927 [Mollisiaceae sp. DMI_Dod_QoI]|nr:hypothetical protein EG329_009927 [Helotiales sp. DMI_Dod_QoI]
MSPTFQTVVSDFRSRLSKAELEDFKFCSLKDVQQAIIDIQAQQDNRRETQNLSRILGFLEAMNQFGAVVEVFLNTSEVLAFVWGPLKFLLLVASNWAESFDALLDTYQQIGEQIPLLLQYQKVFTESSDMRGVLAMMYKDILEFHQQALRVFGKPTWQRIFRAVWKDFNSRFKYLLLNLQRHRILIESHANVSEIKTSQAARELAEKAFQEADEARKDSQRVSVRTWLSARNVQLDHEVHTGVRKLYPSTGLWVLQKTAISAWHDNQHTAGSLVWIHGIPGAGKTVLASVIIEKSRSLPSTIVAYFYCKYKDLERNNFVAVFRAMISQLLVQSKDSDLLQALYDSYGRIVERIEQNENAAARDQALLLLGWVVTAKRPLTWPEIQGAISIDIEDQSVDFEERSLVEDIGALCGSLVERLPGDRVELIHTSARIYLMQDNHVRVSRAEGQLASLCLHYLMFPGFTADDEEICKFLKSGFYAFQNYATLHWVDHLQCYLENLRADDMEDLDNLAPICEEFSSEYGPPDAETSVGLSIQSLLGRCKKAEHQASFETFVALIAYTRDLREKRNSLDGLGNLGSNLTSVRENLERLIETDGSASVQTLSTFYGDLLFKCPRHGSDRTLAKNAIKNSQEKKIVEDTKRLTTM